MDTCVEGTEGETEEEGESSSDEGVSKQNFPHTNPRFISYFANATDADSGEHISNYIAASVNTHGMKRPTILESSSWHTKAVDGALAYAHEQQHHENAATATALRVHNALRSKPNHLWRRRTKTPASDDESEDEDEDEEDEITDPGKRQRVTGKSYTYRLRDSGITVYGIWSGQAWECMHAKRRNRCEACSTTRTASACAPNVPAFATVFLIS